MVCDGSQGGVGSLWLLAINRRAVYPMYSVHICINHMCLFSMICSENSNFNPSVPKPLCFPNLGQIGVVHMLIAREKNYIEVYIVFCL